MSVGPHLLPRPLLRKALAVLCVPILGDVQRRDIPETKTFC